MNPPPSPLIQAYILISEAAQEGFDWDSAFDAAKKVEEELEEVREELNKIDSPSRQQALAEEMGDLFLSCIVLARHCKVEPEEAIALGTKKFKKRYARLKSFALEKGMSIQATSSDELSLLWKELKQKNDGKDSLL